MSGRNTLEKESPDNLKIFNLTQSDEIAPESLPRGSGLNLRTVMRLLRDIHGAGTLEAAREAARGAEDELTEIIRRYELHQKSKTRS
jgi:hypothetical protein